MTSAEIMIHIFVTVRYHKDRLMVGKDLSLGKRNSFMPEDQNLSSGSVLAVILSGGRGGLG